MATQEASMNKADEPGSASDEGASNRPLERRATVGEAPSSSCQPHRWRPRSKSVSNACERCRRRKIRCDGEVGPCSTCVRFCVACIRPPKLKDRMGLGAHRALASRIQQLEAQLAEIGDAHTTAQSPAWGEELWNPFPSTPRPAQPSLHVDTSFDVPQRSFSWDFSSSTDSAGAEGTTTQPEIPTIEISECGGPSPAMLSPAPSLLSANSRCSTPEPYTITTPILGSTLAPPMLGSPVSPPVSACQRPPWEFSHGESNDGYLSPPDHGKLSLSRRSSISSFGLDQDFSSINLQFSPFDDEPQSPGAFSDQFRPQSRLSNQSTTPTGARSPKMPTKFEAETLSDIFFDKVELSQRPVEQSFYHTCLDLVYDFAVDNTQGPHMDVVECLIPPYSLRMARFYVFMTMAIGMRLRTGGRMTDNSLLDSCYHLAMHQAESPAFWSEVGGVEAASLLTLFAKSGEVQTLDQMGH